MKYRNQKTVINGIQFDSKLEAKRYQELKLLEAAGKIYRLTLQPEFELIPKFTKGGKTYRRTVYKADFSYIEVDSGKCIVEDTKGFITPLYALKRKLFEYRYQDMTIKEIKK